MAENHERLEVPGSIVSGELTPDGRLVRHESPGGQVSMETAAIAARFGATVSMVAGTLAAAFSELSNFPMVPERGWIYSGGDWSGMVTGNLWTIVRTADSPFAAILEPGGHVRSVSELLEVPGVVDVGEFDRDARVVAHETRVDLSEELAAHGARFMHTMTHTLDGLGAAFGTLSQGSWTPQHGWLYSGGEFAVIVSKGRWALADAGGVALTEIYGAVLGS